MYRQKQVQLDYPIFYIVLYIPFICHSQLLAVTLQVFMVYLVKLMDLHANGDIETLASEVLSYSKVMY